MRGQLGDFSERALGILRGPRADDGVEIREALGRIRHLLRALPGLLGCDAVERCQQMRCRLAIVFERLSERAIDVELRVTQQQDLERVAAFDRIRERTRVGDHRRRAARGRRGWRSRRQPDDERTPTTAASCWRARRSLRLASEGVR